MSSEVEAKAPAQAPEHRPDELVEFLEPDQLVIDKSRPLPRAELSAAARFGLWGLRVFVLIVSAMVIYTFVQQLG